MFNQNSSTINSIQATQQYQADQPRLKGRHHSDLIKTKMCQRFLNVINHFSFKNKCLRGSACNFAHSTQELKKKPNLQKTQLCVMFQKGKCFKLDCQFAHHQDELRTNSLYTKTSLCHKYLRGSCPYGPHCKFAHGIEDLQSPAQNKRSGHQIITEEQEMKQIQKNLDSYQQMMHILNQTLLMLTMQNRDDNQIHAITSQMTELQNLQREEQNHLRKLQQKLLGVPPLPPHIHLTITPTIFNKHINDSSLFASYQQLIDKRVFGSQGQPQFQEEDENMFYLQLQS